LRESRVLVSGAAGFIGSHLVRTLVAEGRDVHVLVRQGSSLTRLQDVLGQVEVHLSDFSDRSIPDLVREISPAVAFHLAWFTKPGRYLYAQPENLECLSGSLNLMIGLLNAGCERLVLAGTCLEGIEQEKTNIYVAAKRALHSVAGALDTHTMSTVCAHIFYLFGPHEDQHRVIPQVIGSLLKGSPIGVTKGEQVRDYLHVADVAKALSVLGDSNVGGSVDICSGRPVTLRYVLNRIGEETGKAGLIRFGEREYAADEVFEAVGDRAALDEIGWKPSRTLEEGLAQTIDWWKPHLDMG
jgi:nucleoside-diphosphate-sugar epimerase